MKLEYLILIPALMTGWGLGSFLQNDSETSIAPTAKSEVVTVAPTSSTRNFGSSTSAAPTSSSLCREALDKLKNQPDLHPMVRRALQDRALRAWLEIEPAGALSYAEQQIIHRYHANLGQDLFRVWVDLDPEGAKQAFSVASPALINSCFSSFCIDLGKKDAAGTLQFIASRQWVKQGNFGHKETITQIYHDWATRDPKAAILHADSDGDSLCAAYTGWAKIDPLAAWEAAPKSEGAMNMRPILQALAPYILPLNPDLISKIPGSNSDDFARDWVTADFEGARKFAMNLPKDSPVRATLFHEIAGSIATADPEGAIALFQESGGSETSDYTNSGIFRQAFISLNSTNPHRARELLREIPEHHRAVALGGILTNEFAIDPTNASLQCRMFLDNPATRDLVIPALERALSWRHGSGNHDLTKVVETIPELRPKVREYLLTGWVRTAPEAAANFLAEEANHQVEQGQSFSNQERPGQWPNYHSPDRISLPSGSTRCLLGIFKTTSPLHSPRTGHDLIEDPLKNGS